MTAPTAVAPIAPAAPIAEKAFRGLLALGFHKEDAKRAIAIAESTVFGSAVTPETLVRAALARLVDARPRRPAL